MFTEPYLGWGLPRCQDNWLQFHDIDSDDSPMAFSVWNYSYIMYMYFSKGEICVSNSHSF